VLADFGLLPQCGYFWFWNYLTVASLEIDKFEFRVFRVNQLILVTRNQTQDHPAYRDYQQVSHRQITLSGDKGSRRTNLVTHLAIGRPVPLRLGLLLCHVLAMLGIAVPASGWAVIDTGICVHPDLDTGIALRLNRRGLC
jgi:hypothetical protein